MPCSAFWITSAAHELLLYRTALNISKSPVHSRYFKFKTDNRSQVSVQPRLWRPGGSDGLIDKRMSAPQVAGWALESNTLFVYPPHTPTPSAPLTTSKKHQLQPELVFRIATLTGLEPATSAVTGRRANQLRHRAIMIFRGTPNGIRTRVAAVKGRSPRPLDDGSPT